MKRIELSIIAYILTIFSVLGQSNMIPTMTVSEKQSDVVLSKLDIDVVVSGNLATTTFDMFFTNNSKSILEGNFEFPLGEGQSISRYALDINGILREGVVVEKEKARKTFEEIERRKVDPGILEQTAGNNFRTRVYPLNPGKSRHVVIAYEQELSIADGKVLYKLPLQSEKVIDEVSMNVTITDGKVEPIFKRVFQKNAYFAKNGKSYTYSFSKKNHKFAEGIEIELPLKGKDGAQIYIETDSKGSYFSIFDLIEQEASNPKAAVKNLTVIYDVSSSSSNSDKSTNKEIILNYVKSQKISSFRLVTFSNEIHSDKIYTTSEFSKEFDNIVFDGATNFGCLDFNKYDCDEILLFSDGLGNIGGEEPIYGKTPVDIINSSNISNHSFLKSIAQKSHGKYINTQAVGKKKINALLSNNSLEVINIEYDPERVSEIYPRAPHQVTNSISIAGKLNKKDATIKVTLGYGGVPMETRTYTVSAVSSDTLKNVKRIWAQKKLNDLDVNYEKNKKEISRLSKDFSIVTRNTSFIVLESVHDYIRYDITPPAELLDEYNRILGNRNKSLDVDTANAPKIPEKVFRAMTDFRNKYKGCQKITIQGVVTNGEQPIPDVTVSFDTLSVLTDANGHYKIAVKLNSRITFFKEGYYSKTIKVGEDSNDALNVVLEKKIQIKGTVTDGEKPLESVKVESESDGNTYTDANGHYEIEVHKNTELRFYKDEYKHKTIKVGEDSNDALNVVLETKILIKGTVTDGKKPLESVEVESEYNGNTYTDANGHYEIEVYKNTELSFYKGEYKHKTIKVGNVSNNALNVVLKRHKVNTLVVAPEIKIVENDVETKDSQFFDELVVVGYGTQRKSDMTGSVASLSESSSQRKSGRNASANDNSASTNSSDIKQEIKFWSPDNEYMKTLRQTESKEMYGKYLQLKDKYQKSPSFYLDVASYFAEEGMIGNAVRIVSNISEMNLEEAETARSCAKKLMEFKEYSLAASVFERIIGMRGEEPQSYRDLAQAYIELERYQEAADLLYKAGTGEWDSRFRNSQQISLNELGALIAMHPDKIDKTKYDKRLVENFPLDLRIILTWNTNDCDIDLWVVDPNQEKCFYSHKQTKICGWISDDITGGYGPEEFCLIDAIDGDYKIYANYYGSRSPKKLQPVVVQATIYTNFGRPEQKKQIMTLQLENAKDTYKVGTIKFKK